LREHAFICVVRNKKEETTYKLYKYIEAKSIATRVSEWVGWDDDYWIVVI
jgi:hypothetical protein